MTCLDVYMNKHEKTFVKGGIMNPRHEKWDDFVDEMLLWTFDDGWCDHSNRTTRDALVKIKGIDAKRSLKYLKGLGGSCDCEIMEVIADCIHEKHEKLRRIIYLRLAWMQDDFKKALDDGADPWEAVAAIGGLGPGGVSGHC
jgi:hypothetical protein